MKLLFFCPRWGSEHLSWNTFLQKAKDAGYDGIEASIPLEEKEREIILNELAKNNLQFIAQHWETIEPDFEKHIEEYEKRLRAQAAAKPLFINSQTGKDYYSFEQNERLILLAEIVAQETGVPILHETHRGKFSFAAHILQQYLQRIPSLKITLDISHWFTVAETFLQDQAAAVELAISRTEHIHSRVGFTEGPQVNDPRAPEWQEALRHHINCWKKIIELHKNNNREYFTITPEFGAPPYMPLQPYTQKPLTDQWEANVYMMQLLRHTF